MTKLSIVFNWFPDKWVVKPNLWSSPGDERDIASNKMRQFFLMISSKCHRQDLSATVWWLRNHEKLLAQVYNVLTERNALEHYICNSHSKTLACSYDSVGWVQDSFSHQFVRSRVNSEICFTKSLQIIVQMILLFHHLSVAYLRFR